MTEGFWKRMESPPEYFKRGTVYGFFFVDIFSSDSVGLGFLFTD